MAHLRINLLAAAVAGVFTLPLCAHADTAPAAPETAPASPHTFTANVGLYSDYRFRGITQTFGKPAIQGGFDYAHASGFYLGNWNSNVSETAGYPNGNLEMDFYGGFKQTIGDWGYDIGVLYYYYPGSDSVNATSYYTPYNPHSNGGAGKFFTGSEIDNTEVYIAGSWKFISLKYSHATSDYFKIPDTSGSNYLDLSANYDLGNGWGINGHVGHLKVKNYGEADYTDYKLGVTKDLGGFVIGASYISTDAKDGGSTCGNALQPYHFCKNSGTGKSYEGGKDMLVVSVSRTF